MGRKTGAGTAAVLAGLMLATTPAAADAPTPAQQREISALSARIARLAKEATALEDTAAIRRLQDALGYYLDRGLWSEVADLFADDATIEFGNEGVYAGKAHIRAYFLRLGGGKEGLAPGRLDSRIFVMPAIHLAADGRTAKARWKDIAMNGEFQKTAFWGDGAWENTYVKEGGVWKFKAVHRYTTFVAPYDKGWAASERKPDISIAAREVPADRPPTFRYEPFPGVYIPPYHEGLYIPANDPLVKGVMLPGDAVRPANVGPPPQNGPVRVPAPATTGAAR